LQYSHIPKTLELSSSEYSLPHFGFYDEPQCDQDGNMFFHMNTGQYNDGVILKVSSTAKKSTLFKLSDDYRSTAFSKFTITPSGSLRVLAEDKDGYFIFDFNGDGDMTGHTRLALPGHPSISQFASFDNGLSLLAGFIPKDSKVDAGNSVTAIFDGSGKRVKDVAYSHKFDFKADDDMTIGQGYSVAAKDGNFYLLLMDKILVVSSTGEILRTVHFERADARSIVTKLFVSDGTFAILQRIVNAKDGSVKTLISVLYADTGEEIGYYTLPEGSTGHVLCYSRKEGLTAFGYENKRFTLMNATLR
jgi:hypothetical protein